MAIPARNEASRIKSCLAALASQRDGFGAPIKTGSFEVLVYANNCDDGTEDAARTSANVCPHPIVVVSEQLGSDRANAGCARQRAMDLAAERLRAKGCQRGILLTTDADSCVSPTWFAATLEAMTGGVDCVAGYIDAFPAEMMLLGPAFVGRGRLEDHYLRLVAEIYAICDPRPHDPWPNHRVSSGASLAVTLSAYLAVGGMPAQALGEDSAFTRELERAGFSVRHPMSVTVGTSCRFDGRAKGGAADTMRLRHSVIEAPCDDDIEPARLVFRRALWRGCLRSARSQMLERTLRWAGRLGFSLKQWRELLDGSEGKPFEALWAELEATSPLLSCYQTLRPSELPEQIRRAEVLLNLLRNRQAGAHATDRVGIRHQQDARDAALALT